VVNPRRKLENDPSAGRGRVVDLNVNQRDSKSPGKTKRAPPASRSRQSAGKRDAIVRAATVIINAKSFALAKMTEIAAALDLRDATLYYYFPNKQALAYACHRSSLQRFEQLLQRVDEAGGLGCEKLRHLVRGLLVDSVRNGQQLYFGDYSYLDASQRKAIAAWAERLEGTLVRFLKEGIEDGSVRPCEPEFVTQLLLGMLIWLAKWAPKIDGITVDRLMNAIDAFSFQGLERSAAADPVTRGA
jgi:AcrR family transcriptional regulator